MTDLEQRVHHAIGVLAEAEPVAVPPVELVYERAPRTAPPRRSRVLVAAIAIGTLAIAATAAGAAGILPESITRVFHHISSWGKACHVETTSARMLASYRAPDGRVFEWWRAYGARRADGTLATGDDWRIVSPRGKAHDLAWGCQTITWQPDQLVVGGMGVSPVGNVVYGQAPERATAVRGVFRDGTTVGIPLQHGRYFIASLAMTNPSGPVVRCQALDANGSVIASEPNPLYEP